MRIFCLALLSLALIELPAFGQLVDEIPEESTSLFNPDIIKKEGIKKAKATYSIKYDLEKIRTTRKRFIYLFDNNGYVKEVIEIYPNRHRDDSVTTMYFRNKEGKITTKIRTDNRITQVELLEYDDGKLLRHSFYQMGRTSNWNERLYNKYIIWADSLAYNNFGIEVYNRWNIVYKSYQLERNDEGNLTRFATYSRSKQLQQERIYRYSGNRLTEISEKNRNKYMFNWRMTFDYNEMGVAEIKYFKKEDLNYIRKIHYKESGLMELDLKRNEQTKKMTIVKFEYERD